MVKAMGNIIYLYQDIYDRHIQITEEEYTMENYIPTNDSSEMLDTIDRFRSNYSLIGEGVVDKIIDELADVGLYMHDDYDIEDILYYLNNQ